MELVDVIYLLNLLHGPSVEVLAAAKLSILCKNPHHDCRPCKTLYIETWLLSRYFFQPIIKFHIKSNVYARGTLVLEMPTQSAVTTSRTDPECRHYTSRTDPECRHYTSMQDQKRMW